MKLAYIYDHHNAVSEWSKRDLNEWLSDVFAAPKISMGPKCTAGIRAHVEKELQAEGWALDVKVDQRLNLTMFAVKDDMAFQLQTGNISRAPYDMLKLQYLFQAKKIECAALAVPTKAAAKRIASNVANAERISNELQVFNRVITVPIMLIAFE
jgi:hypothetical protein